MLTSLNVKYYNLEDINEEHKNTTDSSCSTLAKVCLQTINKTYDFEAFDQIWTFNKTEATFKTSNKSAVCHEIFQSQKLKR